MQAQQRSPLQSTLEAAGLTPTSSRDGSCSSNGSGPPAEGTPAGDPAGGPDSRAHGRALVAELLSALPRAWLLPGAPGMLMAPAGLPGSAGPCQGSELGLEWAESVGAVGLAAAAAETLLALLRAGAATSEPSAALATRVAAVLGPQVLRPPLGARQGSKQCSASAASSLVISCACIKPHLHACSVAQSTCVAIPHKLV